MGRTVGAGINTIVRSFNLLVGEGGIDCRNIGTKLSVGWRGAIDEISWTELGNALGNGFMIAWNMLSGFVSDMSRKSDAGLTGWAELGIALGKAVKGIFDKINFGEIGTTLATGLNGVMETIRNFTNTVPWSEMATNLSNGFNNFVSTVKWAEVGQTLSDFFVSALGMLAQAAKEFDWEGLGRGIGEMLDNVDWMAIFTEVFTVIQEIITGLIQGLSETTSGKILLAIGAIAAIFKGVQVATAVSEWVTKIQSGLGKVIPFFSETLIPGISTGVAGIIDSGGVLARLVTGASTIVSNLSGVLGTIGSVLFSPTGALIAGIALGVVLIIANWDKISEAASKLKDFVVEKWSQLTEFLSGVPDKIGSIIDSIVNWFDELPGRIGEAIGYVIGRITRWALDIHNTMQTEIPKIIDSTVSFFKELPGKIWSSIASTAEKIKDWATDLYNTVVAEIPKIPEKVIEFFSELPDAIKEIGENLITGFIEGINSMWQNAKENVGEFVDGVIRGFKEGFDTHSPSKITEGIGENVGQGLINGIDNQSGDAL